MKLLTTKNLDEELEKKKYKCEETVLVISVELIKKAIIITGGFVHTSPIDDYHFLGKVAVKIDKTLEPDQWYIKKIIKNKL